jgi:putative copper resistance protein D
MEDSINLKKRILRMREANNTDNVIINPKTFNVKDSVPRKLIKENVFTNSNASINNISENINIKSNTDNNFSSIKNTKKTIQYNYNAQFKLLANKFNEAVEVILELNDRVKNLEKIVYSKNVYTPKINQNKNNYKIKLGFSLSIIISVLLSPFFLLIDLDLSSIFKVDVWIFFNPIIRMLFYISAFCSVGTFIYLIHFNRFLEVKQKSYCFFLVKRSSIIGCIIAFLSFLSIPGNMGGDLKSIIDPELIQLTLETISGKATLLSLIGFIIIYFSCLKQSIVFYLLSVVGISSLLLSFVMFGHSTKHGLVGQFLIIIHLVGLSYWIGALLPLRKMCNFIDKEKLKIVAHLFGIYAIGYVGVLITAGLIFSYILLGDISALISTDYGNVLLIKMIVVSTLLSLGAINKFKIIPNLSIDQNLGLKRLKKSIQTEILCVLLIFFLTSLLTTSLILPMGT